MFPSNPEERENVEFRCIGRDCQDLSCEAEIHFEQVSDCACEPEPPALNITDLIAQECDNLKTLLLEKNKKYGNSALKPLRIFSRANEVEQLFVRIDDKLSRINTVGLGLADEDTLQDLIGYLVLLSLARKHFPKES